MEEEQIKKDNFFISFIKSFFESIAWATLILLIIITMFITYYIISTDFLNNQNTSNKSPIGLYTITSTSMKPNLVVNDVVISIKSDVKDLNKGDIITFYSNNKDLKGNIITHRITNIKKTNNDFIFKTKGDNNDTLDPGVIKENNIFGKVMFRIPYLGKLPTFLNTITSSKQKMMFIFSFISIILLVSTWIIFKKAKEHGWAAIVPLYNSYVLFKITFGHGWFFLFLFIPILNIIFGIIFYFKLAKVFNKGIIYGFALIYLPYIFIPALAFGKSKYIGIE